MKAYKVTTPNNGTQYATTAQKAFDLLNNDGWDWSCGMFTLVVGSEVSLSFNPRLNGMLDYLEVLDKGEYLIQSGIELSAYSAPHAEMAEKLMASNDVMIQVIELD
jgi:hypothetical protein